jgi:hypothetical protein
LHPTTVLAFLDTFGTNPLPIPQVLVSRHLHSHLAHLLHSSSWHTGWLPKHAASTAHPLTTSTCTASVRLLSVLTLSPVIIAAGVAGKPRRSTHPHTWPAATTPPRTGPPSTRVQRAAPPPRAAAAVAPAASARRSPTAAAGEQGGAVAYPYGPRRHDHCRQG